MPDCKHQPWTCFYERRAKIKAHCQKCHAESPWCASRTEADNNMLPPKSETPTGEAEIFT